MSDIEPAGEHEQEPRQWLYGWPTDSFLSDFEQARAPGLWVELFSHQSQLLGEVAHALSLMCKGDTVPSMEKLEAVIEDVHLRDKVIRTCNEVFQSNSGNLLRELSRAIVMLGGLTVRNLAFVNALIERCVVEPTPRPIIRYVTKAYMVGVTTLVLGKHKTQVANAQEYFLAGFMSQFPMLAAILFASNALKPLESQLHGVDLPNQTQEDLFGFQLKELLPLCQRQWFLGDVFAEYLKSTSQKDVTHVAIALVEGLYAGYHSDELFEAKREVASFLGGGPDDVQDVILESLERCAEGIGMFENRDLMAEIPFDKGEEEVVEVQEVVQTLEIEIDEKRVAEALDMLIKLPHTDHAQAEHIYLETLNGFIEGVDFDRAALVFYGDTLKQMHIKHVRQVDSQSLLERFEIDLESPDLIEPKSLDMMGPQGYLIRNIMRESKFTWVGNAIDPVLKRLRTCAFNDVFGAGQFFIAPIMTNKRKLGFFFCDRQLSKRRLDMKSFDMFYDLCVQANKSLEEMGSEQNES